MDHIGTEIRRRREERGLSQTQLAAAVGTGSAAISRIENGRQVPQLPLLVRLAGALGFEVRDLFPKGSAPPPQPSLFNQAGAGRSSSRELIEIARGAASEQARLDAQAIARGAESGQPQGSAVTALNEAFERLRKLPSADLAEALVDLAREYVQLEQNAAALQAQEERSVMVSEE